MEPAIRSPLVRPHHADLAEPGAAVAGDGGDIVGRWIDDDAVMASIGGEMIDEQPHRSGADAASMSRGVDEDVDPGMAVVHIALLGPLDEPHDVFLVTTRGGRRCADDCVGVNGRIVGPVWPRLTPRRGDDGMTV